jgi:hypothetical protein
MGVALAAGPSSHRRCVSRSGDCPVEGSGHADRAAGYATAIVVVDSLDGLKCYQVCRNTRPLVGQEVFDLGHRTTDILMSFVGLLVIVY